MGNNTKSSSRYSGAFKRKQKVRVGNLIRQRERLFGPNRIKESGLQTKYFDKKIQTMPQFDEIYRLKMEVEKLKFIIFLGLFLKLFFDYFHIFYMIFE
jgi:hypothetical protein